MERLSVKQLQLAGVGIIRADLEKATVAGKIYKATLYYKDMTTDVRILYKRSGKGFIIGPDITPSNSLQNFETVMTSILPELPLPNYKNLATIRIASIIAIFFTLLNVITPITNIYGVIAITLDIIGLIALAMLYRAERETYVKVKK